MLVPQRAGPVALFAVVAPFPLAAIVVMLLPLAVLRRDALLAAAVTACSLAGALAYPSPPLPAGPTSGSSITIMTWNLHGERPAEVGLQQGLDRWSPDVIVLQESRIQDTVALLPDDMTILTFPDAATPPGMVIASRLPILDRGQVTEPLPAWDRPRAFWIEVDTGSGPITVVGVHLSVPFPPSSLPCPYCPTLRDAQVAALADFAAARAAAGEIAVVVGDFNMTDREVAYRDLRGLTDTARGATWRPLALAWLPPFLRLDYVFVTPGIGARSTVTGCAISSSDHCPLVVELAVPGGTAAAMGLRC